MKPFFEIISTTKNQLLIELFNLYKNLYLTPTLLSPLQINQHFKITPDWEINTQTQPNSLSLQHRDILIALAYFSENKATFQHLIPQLITNYSTAFATYNSLQPILSTTPTLYTTAIFTLFFQTFDFPTTDFGLNFPTSATTKDDFLTYLNWQLEKSKHFTFGTQLKTWITIYQLILSSPIPEINTCINFATFTLAKLLPPNLFALNELQLKKVQKEYEKEFNN